MMGFAIAICVGAIIGSEPARERLVALDRLPDFPPPGATATVDLPVVDASFSCTESICSWNVGKPGSSSIQVEAAAADGPNRGKWFCLGRWSAAGNSPRQSVGEQKDATGDVLTDTLRLLMPANKLALRLTMFGGAPGDEPRLKLLAVCFSSPGDRPPDVPMRTVAWGTTIDVPQKSQMPFEFGKMATDAANTPAEFATWYSKAKTAQFCSPTSLAMTLDFWSAKLGRPELGVDVPDAAKGVFDMAYPGTGNWPFNTAYAGSFDGMTAYVARLDSIAELETWIAAGIPVVCSVSNRMLQGTPSAGDDGHLVVLVGFSATGDPVFNDPGRSEAVRQTYARADFDRAWNHSSRTVYLIYPTGHAVPPSAMNHWIPQP